MQVLLQGRYYGVTEMKSEISEGATVRALTIYTSYTKPEYQYVLVQC